MTQSKSHENDDGNRFHQIVAEGDLEELQVALKDGADPNAPGHVGMTALMLALQSKDLKKTKLLVENGADPELTDDFNATALRHAVDADFADGVRLLLSLGVDRGYHPRHPLKKIDYDFPLPDRTMSAELKGVLSDAEWQESVEETNRSVREMMQHPTVEPTISGVQSVEVLNLFLEAGDDLNLAPTEIKRALVGLETGDELRVSPNDYRRHKSPRFGRHNPELMDFPFWKDMIRTGGHSYSARQAFNDENLFTKLGVVWCYDRFGSSLTPLKDGRFVQIGGEHEDYYHSDFYIYNDVVIHDGKGNSQIYGYPRDVFPPTDFHSATLCPDGIYIIGCLGYMEQRQPGFTPVYRLTLESWKIEPVKTFGEMPGWIHNHHASYEPTRNVIIISSGKTEVLAEGEESELVANERQYELDLGRSEWRRIE